MSPFLSSVFPLGFPVVTFCKPSLIFAFVSLEKVLEVVDEEFYSGNLRFFVKSSSSRGSLTSLLVAVDWGSSPQPSQDAVHVMHSLFPQSTLSPGVPPFRYGSKALGDSSVPLIPSSP